MAKTLLTVLAFVIVQSSFAQDVPEWMVMRFGQESANALHEQDQAKFNYYVALDQGFHLEDVSPKDVSEYEDALLVESKVAGAPALSLELIMSEDFHPELYKFNRQKEGSNWYRVGDSNYLITIYSFAYVKEKFDSEQ